MTTTNITKITLSPKQEPCPSWVLDMLIAFLADREVEVSAVQLSAVPVYVEQLEVSEAVT